MNFQSPQAEIEQLIDHLNFLTLRTGPMESPVCTRVEGCWSKLAGRILEDQAKWGDALLLQNSEIELPSIFTMYPTRILSNQGVLIKNPDKVNIPEYGERNGIANIAGRYVVLAPPKYDEGMWVAKRFLKLSNFPEGNEQKLDLEGALATVLGAVSP